MRRIRILSIIIFILSAAVFCFFKISDKKSEDTNGPVIHMTENSIEVSTTAGKEELLAGVTATDEKDGDVSGSIVIERMTNFTEKGKRTMIIAACDSDHNVTKETREIIYSDYQSPTFELEAPLNFSVNATSFTDGLTASDRLDGDLTHNIKMSVSENKMYTAGDYQVLFSVSNSAGDVTSLPVTVTLYDPSEIRYAPEIVLTDYLVYVKKGASISPWSYIDEVNYRGTVYVPEKNSEGKKVLAEKLKEEPENNQAAVYGISTADTRKYITDIDITNPVDTNTPGTYEILYKVTAGEDYENETGTMRLIVVVEE